MSDPDLLTQNQTLAPEDIRFNAASGAFEALVHLQNPGMARSFACAFAAPLDTPINQVQAALIAQARSRQFNNTGLSASRDKQLPTPMRAAPRPRAVQRAIRWLNAGPLRHLAPAA